LLKRIDLSVFRFQQFDVVQSKNPLKVGTDSMVLGSFIDASNAMRALDIGAGTGVLTLMVLQNNPSLIVDAVEIHQDAAEECAFNLRQSSWGEHATVYPLDFLVFQPEEKYDLIYSNPPFYFEGLKSGVESIDQAKHITKELFEQFMVKTAQILNDFGRFYVIIPGNQVDFLCAIASENELQLIEKIAIHATEEKLNSRAILVFSKHFESLKKSELTIRSIDGNYTLAYIALTKKFHFKDLSSKI
jgi:tRNA1Val (adenine37-N6)-methyltransferase